MGLHPSEFFLNEIVSEFAANHFLHPLSDGQLSIRSRIMENNWFENQVREIFLFK